MLHYHELVRSVVERHEAGCRYRLRATYRCCLWYAGEDAFLRSGCDVIPSGNLENWEIGRVSVAAEAKGWESRLFFW